jgi:bifunctional non-homologous end joining protein LigD
MTASAAALPAAIAPMLATPGGLPTNEAEWAYEPKWDGIRAIVRLAGDSLAATSRNGQDLVPTFPELGELPALVAGAPTVLDGELVALSEDGVPRFSLLQQRLNITSASTVLRRSGLVPVTFVVFDLLHFRRHSLVDLSYDERRAALERLNLSSPSVTTTQVFRDVPGRTLFEAVRERGLEGLMAKRRTSPYLPGRRSGHWLKIKAIRTQEVVVGGWTAGQGQLRDVFGALMLGIPEPLGLRYVGKVGTGFDTRARLNLLEQLQPLAIDHCPFFDEPEPKDRVGAQYVKPAIVGEVQFSEWTRDGRLRHPSWRGLRPDKNVDQVVRES